MTDQEFSDLADRIGRDRPNVQNIASAREHALRLRYDAQQAIERHKANGLPGEAQMVMKVRGHRTREKVRVMPGLTGRLLGHVYPGETAVRVAAANVIRVMTKAAAEAEQALTELAPTG